MRVLFVASGNNKAFSIAPFVKSQGEALIQQGVEVDFFTIKGKGLFGYLANVAPLRKRLKFQKYNIIHAHYSLTGWIAVLAFSKLPIVVSYMGSDTYGDYNKKGRIKPSSYFQIVASMLLQLFINAIIIKSEKMKRYIYQKKKVYVVANGVYLNDFETMDRSKIREELNLNENTKYALFLGNPLDTRKNIQLFEKSISYCSEHFEVVKPYPLPSEYIPKYLNACDLLVLTSYNEGSPNVIKEAMACNCPIVSTDVGDVRDVFGNTKGCYIASFDPGEVAKKIDIALQYNERTKGRERIIELGLDSHSVAKRIINIYEKVLA